MAPTGADIVAELQRDLACPKCAYNLRGLRGAVVNCPECGERCDIAQLVARKWTKPWYKAPGFNRLLMPVTILVVALFTCMVALILLDDETVPGIMLAAAIFGWVAMLVHIGRRQGLEGVGLALLAHVVFGGYLAGAIAILNIVLGAARLGVPAGKEVLWTLVTVAMLAICGALLWLCRRGEKFIAHRCIKRYLGRPES